MKSAVILVFGLAAITLGGCCTNWVDSDTFGASPLPEQIREYERGIREHCIRREMGGLTLDMARHGLDSANAMIELIRHPSPDFPLEDAVDILEWVHALGTDLRHHESMQVLENLATTASDPRVRAKAKETFELIKSHNPGEVLHDPTVRWRHT